MNIGIGVGIVKSTGSVLVPGNALTLGGQVLTIAGAIITLG